MAKVWWVHEGDRPTLGGPAGVVPFARCVEALGLRREQWLGVDTPRFPVDRTYSDFLGPDHVLAGVRDPQHVVVELGEDEVAHVAGWRAGFYVSLVTPVEAAERLSLPPPHERSFDVGPRGRFFAAVVVGGLVLHDVGRLAHEPRSMMGHAEHRPEEPIRVPFGLVMGLPGMTNTSMSIGSGGGVFRAL